MNKGKKRCGGCSWFVGKLKGESEGICSYWGGRVDVDDSYAVKCGHFKRNRYVRNKGISVTSVDY